MRITILGCGNGAWAAAADLTSRGHEVTLYSGESRRKRLQPLIDNDNLIRLRNVDDEFDVRISRITCNPEEALKDTELIMPVIPANSHESVAEEIAPYLSDGSRVMLVPGSTGGALVFARKFRELIPDKKIILSEMHTLPYACRKTGGHGVHILLNVGLLFFAALPATYNEEMFAIAKELYPACVLAKDVLETSLNNGNATTHPAPVVLNAGKIEFYGKHFHYEEGITPSVARVIQGIDDERKAICTALGYEALDVKDRLCAMGYASDNSSVYNAIRSSKDVFLPLEGPNDLGGRYLTEDTPCSLVAMAEFGKLAGVPTPLMDSVIALAAVLREEDYRATGRTMAVMGIDGMDAAEIEKYIRGR